MNALLSVSQIESWRLLIVGPDRAEILLGSVGATFSLPEIAIPPQERIAANINREVERRFGLRVISLYEIHPDSPALPDGVFYHAVLSVYSSEPDTKRHHLDADWFSICRFVSPPKRISRPSTGFVPVCERHRRFES